MVTSSKKVYIMVCSESLALRNKDWLSQMPELGIIALVEPVFVFEERSSDITPEVWIKLAEEIHQRTDKASGFVVIHGLDNLLYTSSALSILLQNLTKPIVFTGAQAELPTIKRFDIRANLINAVQAATFDFTEVALMFGNRLLRANQAVRTNDQSLNLFTVPVNSVLGRIDFSIRIFDKIAARNKGKTKLFGQLSNRVEIIEINPVLNLRNLTKKLIDRDGIIINAAKYQNIPHDLMFLLEKITTDMPVVIWSEQITDFVLTPKNIILINNMTWESAVIKFSWALTQSKNLKKIKELMNKDIAGEIV
ncbi:asparaginase [Candidatus Falkowbacteria bacterium]|nr:asparaginase [Candidatus Falkowbacteria bacterium]